MAVLVTGGAGYIGSVAVEKLLERGESVVVVDNLSRGHRAAVQDGAVFYQADVGNREVMSEILKAHQIDACLHFAAYAYVGESVAEPTLYYQNNVVQGLNLFDCLIEHGIDKVIFSSSCATYGEPIEMPISETHPQYPVNPYGMTKLFNEKSLFKRSERNELRFVALRYFNAAGASELHGEHHEPETHLIPLIIAAAEDESQSVYIFGDDYPTNDGTAVRDYIHVEDLAQAHLLALDYLRTGEQSDVFNLGTGSGFSVREMISSVEKVTGKKVNSIVQGRRQGDPSHLVADASKAERVLRWKPVKSDPDTLVRSAWLWKQRNPKGYPEV
jgi:UDP-glucose 4-epimerase